MLSPLEGLGGPASAGWPYLCADCHAGLPWWPADAAPEPLPGIDRLHVACRYDEPVGGWVRQLKYGRRDGLVRLLARLLPLSDGMPDVGPDRGPAGPLVVPVPLHRRRLWQRGFNQSLLLARAWQRRAARRARAAWRGPDAAIPAPELAPRVLVRHRYTPPQVRMSAAERHTNVADAFSLHPRLREAGPRPLAGRTVLLVDDVVTTGATLSACARMLRDAGAASVQALVVARARG